MKNKTLMTMILCGTFVGTTHAAVDKHATGTYTLNVTEECAVQLTDNTESLRKTDLTEGKLLAGVGLSATGCANSKVAFSADAGTLKGTNILLKGADKTSFIPVFWETATAAGDDSHNWTATTEGIHRNSNGPWEGTIRLRVIGDQTSAKAQAYTLVLNGGTWIE